MPSTRDQHPYNVAYYAKNRDAEIARVTVRQQATLAWLRELRTVPCMDCGGIFPPYVMDFDHRDPKTKLFSLAAGKSLLKNRVLLEAEVAKCDVVCANCHRIRTAAQYATGILVNAGYASPAALLPGARAERRRRKWHERRDQQMDFLDRIRQLPCADCGRSFPICVMEFDHRDSTLKRALVPQLAGRVTIATLLEEIAKCDIVCTNCHRERSYLRRQRAVDPSGCVVMAASKASILEVRVRFPPPARSQPRLIEESATPYRYAA